LVPGNTSYYTTGQELIESNPAGGRTACPASNRSAFLCYKARNGVVNLQLMQAELTTIAIAWSFCNGTG
jgi:hypothetical protein